jgi:D-alanyl-D-alanine carboxypeptidase
VLVIAALSSCVFADGVSAGSAILIDADSGESIYEKNAETKRLIASTTKIMTALVVIENCSLDEVVTIPKECERVGGSSMYLRAGDKFTVRELLYGLLLMSGNDAGLALAKHCGGGKVAAFVKMMNAYAKKLELSGTSFENPHGLDGEHNYSTARDMALLAAAAMENKTFYEISSTKEISIAGRNMKNHNKLLWRMDGVVGVKTGFTKKAGRCLVSCIERDGRRFIAVTLSDPDDWNDHEKLYSSVFDELDECVVAEQGQYAAEVPVLTGGSAAVCYAEDAALWLTPYERETMEIRINMPPFIYDTPEPGTIAGFAEVVIRGAVMATVDLIYS